MHRLAVRAAAGLLKQARGLTDADVKEEVGVSPRLVGAMAAIGAETTNPLHQMVVALYNAIKDSKGLPDEAGVPLEKITGLSHSEKDVIRSFLKKNKLEDVPIFASGDELVTAFHRGPGSGVGGSQIHLGSNSVPAALHEIGHAITHKSSAGRTLSRVADHTGAGTSYGNIGRVMLGSAVLAPPREGSGDVSRFMYAAAPALVGATFAPQLLEEAIASYHALKGAKTHGIGLGTALRELAPAYGTYVAPAAAAVLATILAKKVVKALYQRAEEKREAEKHASPMAGHEVKAPGALRADASSAWRIGGTPPKPKTTTPGGRSARAQETPKAAPPSNASFHRDAVKSLYDPERGSRLAR